MAGTRFAGAWARKASTPTLAVPLKPGPDPEHLTPPEDFDLSLSNPLWVESTPAPSLPDSLTAQPFGTPVGGGGPVDHTPESHDWGIGVTPGLTTEQSQAVMGEWHQQDLGSVASRQWQPTTDREAGEGPHVAVLYDTPGDGASPQTLVYESSGVGDPTDPYARTGKRISRWWDRFIDRHMWGVEYRPMYAKHAYTAPEQPAVPNGTQLDSPFSTPGPYEATADRFVNPQMRRQPRPWDEPLTTDGVGASELGATVWGL